MKKMFSAGIIALVLLISIGATFNASAIVHDGSPFSSVQYAGKTEGFLLFDVSIAG